MVKTVVISAFVIIMIGILLLMSEMKNAYKVLPIKASGSMEVSPFAEWREFTSQTSHFKVSLPMPPQYAEENVSLPDTNLKRHYEMYVSEKLNGSIFMVSLITYPEGYHLSDENQTLHDLVTEMMQRKADNRLQESEDTFYRGHTALDFFITNDAFDLKGKTFIIDKTIYLLSYIARRNDFTLAEYDHFIDSFQLMPQKN